MLRAHRIIEPNSRKRPLRDSTREDDIVVLNSSLAERARRCRNTSATPFIRIDGASGGHRSRYASISRVLREEIRALAREVRHLFQRDVNRKAYR